MGKKKEEAPITNQDPSSETLEEKALRLEKELADANSALETSNKDVATLNQQLAEYESGKKKAPVFQSIKVDKEEYQIVLNQIRVGALGVVTAADVKANKLEVETKDGKVKIANHLVAIQSGMLRLKTK